MKKREMERVKEYLNQIKVPFEEEQTDGMTVLKLKYCEDLLAIFPPDEGEEEFHAVTVYDGKVQQYARMPLEKLKQAQAVALRRVHQAVPGLCLRGRTGTGEQGK